ncbi:hypothetical protein F3J23_14720 [Chryseobacterium sp. Tr-659]|uniref:hypothetical protein n=1 Tax=Chryseobacterium sp. Tr-659 TaxID=2608340 RepID=UPI00141E3632|nr:hypothetical protein [Chryseobacterium sp. Tr-659]NIF06700.1 hypothetical protein [Chryseobacterium sp. Tr-659]
MKKKILLIFLTLPLFYNSQVGINSLTPQKTLHVNGSLQIVNELNLGGSASKAGSAGLSGQVLKSNGPGVAPSWQNLAGVPTSTGTVIVVDGQFMVAQEIAVQLTADFTASATLASTVAIGNLTNEIIDNENTFKGSSTTNSFKVSNNGIYQVIINAQLSTTNGSLPVIGIWDDTNNKWIARVNDTFTAPTSGGLQTYTLLTDISMSAANTYSFRLSNTNDVTIRQTSGGSSGTGPVSQVSLKRLK